MLNSNMRAILLLAVIFSLITAGFVMAAEENPLTGIDQDELDDARAQTGDAKKSIKAGYTLGEQVLLTMVGLSTVIGAILSYRWSMDKDLWTGKDKGSIRLVSSVLVIGLILGAFVMSSVIAVENNITGIDTDDLNEVRENQVADAKKTLEAGYLLSETTLYGAISFAALIGIGFVYKLYKGKKINPS